MPSSEAPTKMTLTDLQSNETVFAMFNPNELKRKISAVYARREVLGLSHQPHEYLRTNNQGIEFSLFHNVETPLQLDESTRALKFLESLLYGPEDPESIGAAAPPRVLIVWPNTMSMTTRLMDLEITYQRWNMFGDPTQWTARCTWEESRIHRLTKVDVRTFGARRTPQGQVTTGDDLEVGEATVTSGDDIDITF